MIGNNVQTRGAMFTQTITLAQLMGILQFYVVTNGLKRDTAKKGELNLFPETKKSENEEHPETEYLLPRKPGKHTGSSQS